MVQHASIFGDRMTPIEIAGQRYFTANQVADTLGVDRTTFYRWRKKLLVPQGQEFRDGRLLFTEADVAEAREFANRIGSEREQRGQLRLPLA
ncbi:MAG TPA: helix-turn-helix domain-containing protein [Longimicrobium sp.]|jgi:predicted DNA-binding transcriptional regulator AlpA